MSQKRDTPNIPTTPNKKSKLNEIWDDMREHLELSTMEVVKGDIADIGDVWLVVKRDGCIRVTENDRRPIKGPIYHNQTLFIQGQDVTVAIDKNQYAEGRANAEKFGRLNFVECIQRETWTKKDQKTVEGLSPQEVFLAKVNKAAREELASTVKGTPEVAFCIRRKGSSKCKAIVVLDDSQLELNDAFLAIRNETNISSPVRVKFRESFDPIFDGIEPNERFSYDEGGYWSYKNPYRENSMHHTFMPLEDACSKINSYLWDVIIAKRDHPELSLKMYADHCIIDLEDEFRKHI